MKSKNIIFYILIVFISVFSLGRFLDTGRMMIPEFTVPYFSGAALLHSGAGWQFNLNEVDTLHRLLSIEDKNESRDKINTYRFSSGKIALRSYSINQQGYLYVALLARSLFSWTGEIGAVKLLQLLVHSLLSLLILLALKTKRDRVLFFFLYVVNPFILYYAIYPFYYFWEVIPSAFLVYFFLSRRPIPFISLLVISIFFAFIFQVRSTVFVINILTLIFASGHLLFYKRAMVLIVYGLSIWAMQPRETHKHPGHIMYTSLAAYPNSYVKNFSDTTAWNAYRKHTGINYSYASSPGMYDSEVFFGESEWGLDEYKKIVIENPLLILRNAMLNLCQSFSFGYFRSSLLLSYLSALFGFMFILLLIVKKKYKLITGITAASCTFCLYLAPLPIYLYGSYILILIAFIEILKEILPEKQNEIRA